jgi:hypothetical protein
MIELPVQKCSKVSCNWKGFPVVFAHAHGERLYDHSASASSVIYICVCVFSKESNRTLWLSGSSPAWYSGGDAPISSVGPDDGYADGFRSLRKIILPNYLEIVHGLPD